MALQRYNTAHLASYRHCEGENCFGDGLRVDAWGIEDLDIAFAAGCGVNLIDTLDAVSEMYTLDKD
jgi:hypothetical protein